MNRFISYMRRICLALILMLTAAGPLLAQGCAENHIDIRGPFGQARFSVEVVDTIATRARGLMHRASMPASHGMLFVYRRPQEMSFWMKNTLIPLDMLFITPQGQVAHIHENAVPHDETPIWGGDGIQYVFEINGGMARKLGIRAGDTLRHPSFHPAKSLWSCKE